MDGKVDDLGLHNALYDITWVVGCMADMPTPGGKHAQEDELDSSVKKLVHTLIFYYFSS